MVSRGCEGHGAWSLCLLASPLRQATSVYSCTQGWQHLPLRAVGTVCYQTVEPVVLIYVAMDRVLLSRNKNILEVFAFNKLPNTYSLST